MLLSKSGMDPLSWLSVRFSRMTFLGVHMFPSTGSSITTPPSIATPQQFSVTFVFLSTLSQPFRFFHPSTNFGGLELNPVLYLTSSSASMCESGIRTVPLIAANSAQRTVNTRRHDNASDGHTHLLRQPLVPSARPPSARPIFSYVLRWNHWRVQRWRKAVAA